MNHLKQIVTVSIALLFCCSGFSQDNQEKELIKKSALDYIEGYFYKDAQRMERALHPELVKRCLQKSKDGREFVINLSASYMIMRAATNKNRHAKNPEGKIESKVEIFDLVGNAASVKVATNQYSFIDYLHMVKYKGEWKILNVLWTYVPKEKK